VTVLCWCGTADRVEKSGAAAVSSAGLPDLNEPAAVRRPCAGRVARVVFAQRQLITAIRQPMPISGAAGSASAATGRRSARTRARPVRRSRGLALELDHLRPSVANQVNSSAATSLLELEGWCTMSWK
jgi:hypothetical protein